MDFIILKVNGIDVSSFPHEDAVRAFLMAQEPIVVEVKRRLADPTCDARPSSSNTPITTGVQTDVYGLAWVELPTLEYLAHEIDLEEVTLRKCTSEEKLGLTVCYTIGAEVDTSIEVYIRDIVPHSVAERDGRLRHGDQILQVNGKDVSTKDETELLFTENSKAVTLLVSRCLARSEDLLDADSPHDEISPSSREPPYENCLIEQVALQQGETSTNRRVAIPLISPHAPLNLTNTLIRSKIKVINHEISELSLRMQKIQIVKTDKRRPPIFEPPAPPESDPEHIYETIPESAESEIEPIYSCPYEPDQDVMEHWLKGRAPECKGQGQGHRQSQSQAKPHVHFQVQGPSQPNKEGARGKGIKGNNGKAKGKSLKSNSSGEEHENSSSAYNTGGSSNSNPLTAEFPACSNEPRPKNTYRSTLVLCACPEDAIPIMKKRDKEPNGHRARAHASIRPKKTRASGSKVNSPISPTTRTNYTVPHFLSDTMYTNVANLQQTIILQQQLFRQALVQKSCAEVGCKPTTSFTAPSLSQYQFVSSQQSYKAARESATMDPKMEWKVKRRPDGTRYIAKRPVRNRILRNRAIRISEERAGLTTEDDNTSEFKVGRYWTKDERKKHLEKSRHRKQRQEILQASKNIEVVDDGNAAGCSKKTGNLETGKKHKNKKSSKDGPSGQETLAHGPRVMPSSANKMIGLLSVTTV